ncbi:hypothetical protein [uncultured Selenomonas sp.]|uniref:hypothetical protein n=1 Tax=uncultured Selenomonas sp. TaxID=159275 RepID=UPI002675341D|nr:hypothetical protein [uncultured Selenomonas sp.]
MPGVPGAGKTLAGLNIANARPSAQRRGTCCFPLREWYSSCRSTRRTTRDRVQAQEKESTRF